MQPWEMQYCFSINWNRYNRSGILATFQNLSFCLHNKKLLDDKRPRKLAINHVEKGLSRNIWHMQTDVIRRQMKPQFLAEDLPHLMCLQGTWLGEVPPGCDLEWALLSPSPPLSLFVLVAVG